MLRDDVAMTLEHPRSAGPAATLTGGLGLKPEHFGEALASAADQLEDATQSPRLIAAIAACIESLTDREGLEHPAFPERASHFAQRLESMAAPGAAIYQRSAILDSLFVSEANELLERMRDALERLPPDAYALKLAATELALGIFRQI